MKRSRKKKEREKNNSGHVMRLGIKDNISVEKGKHL